MPTLDHDLNATIVRFARSKFPQGFEVRDTQAPENLSDVAALLDNGERFVVWSGGSEKTIFGDAYVNWCFRAWHDWHHWQARAEFTPDGEREACARQVAELIARYGDNALTRQWVRILDCEVNGQLAYAAQHGDAFPENQYAFAVAYLDNPQAAVSRTF